MSEKNQLATIYKGLDESLDKQMAALPQGFNKQRFLQNCMTVLQENDFSKCEARTVVRTLMKGAFLGLDFFNKGDNLMDEKSSKDSKQQKDDSKRQSEDVKQQQLNQYRISNRGKPMTTMQRKKGRKIPIN